MLTSELASVFAAILAWVPTQAQTGVLTLAVLA